MESKSIDKASAALAEVIALFESGDFPATVAQTMIARAEGDSPSAAWSLGNQLLMILAGTTDARGFRQWKEVGRSVKKGSKAFTILAPRMVRVEKGTETEHMACIGFLGIPVFRIEDTEGKELERSADYRPAEFPPLFEVSQRLGITVNYAPDCSRFRGYYMPSTNGITLMTHDVDVYFHELAHAAHRQVLRARGTDLRGGQIATQEIIAETVSATLCHLYGFEGYLYEGAQYIRSYARGAKNPAQAAMRCLRDISAVLAVILDAPAAELETAAAA